MVTSDGPLNAAVGIMAASPHGDEWISPLMRVNGWLKSNGYRQGQECIETVRVAISLLGRPYAMTEEIDANTIDCSTLTSEAHWRGAAVGIPFTAERQRVAGS